MPFCAKRCYYCSFNTAPLGDAATTARYLAAVRGEIGLLAAAPFNALRLALASLFFGGGTPSLLEPAELGSILDTLRAGFTLAPDAEITVECNPESVTRAKLETYRASGVNRISLGVQTLDDAILPTLGRLHTARGAAEAFTAAREAGLTNVSVDLMYGLPALDLAGWQRTVRAVLDWEPDHLSGYALTLDPGSVWGAAGVGGLPQEETTIAQYRALCAEALARGYEHYEISNWARPGFRSHHNLTYWSRGEYLAAGPGACGFVGDLRWSNLKPLARYCAMVESGRLPTDSFERLTPRQALAEALFLGLRTADGVPAAKLAERLDGDAVLARQVVAWREAGLLTQTDGRDRLTEDGFLVSDALFAPLL